MQTFVQAIITKFILNNFYKNHQIIDFNNMYLSTFITYLSTLSTLKSMFITPFSNAIFHTTNDSLLGFRAFGQQASKFIIIDNMQVTSDNMTMMVVFKFRIITITRKTVIKVIYRCYFS